MKQILRKLSIAALAMVGVMITSCICRLEEPRQPQQGNAVTLTTSIELGTPGSKALTAAGVKTFAAGEMIAVVYEDSNGHAQKAVSTALTGVGDIFNEGKKATITVTLTDPKAGGALCYIYPASMAKASIATDASVNAAGTIDYTRLAAQDGTLATLSGSLDLAVYEGTLTGEATLPASASLANPLCIGEFTLQDKDDSNADITSTVTRFSVTDGTNTYTVTRAAAAGPIYVAMLPVPVDKTITLTAVSGSQHYLKSVTGKALAASNMYPIAVAMPQDMHYEPLTIVTTEANTRIYVRNVARNGNGQAGAIKYTVDDGAETLIPSYPGSGTERTLYIDNAGSIVRFYGDNVIYNGTYIVVDRDCYIYGNVMSLISSTEYPTATALTRDEAFRRLFNHPNVSTVNKLKNHPSKELLLPATTLTEGCYSNMFSGCTGLVTAPSLPATTMAEGCYYGMFSGCTSLVTAPALPAETLANQCYEYMFQSCSSLASAPALPAETLADRCYLGMFHSCSSLASAPALPAETLADQCYQSMFQSCTSLGSAPALPATTLAQSCYYYMFRACTSLTTAPVLPAPKLVQSCYWEMFSGCTKLSSVTCHATDISATSCTKEWLKNAGTDSSVTSRQFFTPASTAWASPSVDGIPENWTRVDLVSP